MDYFLKTLWSNEEGQDIAEYSVMLAVVLVIVLSTVRLIGGTPARCSRKSAAQSSRQGSSLAGDHSSHAKRMLRRHNGGFQSFRRSQGRDALPIISANSSGR